MHLFTFYDSKKGLELNFLNPNFHVFCRIRDPGSRIPEGERTSRIRNSDFYNYLGWILMR